MVQGLRVSGSAGSAGSQGLRGLSRAVVQGLQSLSRRSGVPGEALSGRLKLDELKEFNGFLAPHRPWVGCEAVNIDKIRWSFSVCVLTQTT